HETGADLGVARVGSGGDKVGFLAYGLSGLSQLFQLLSKRRQIICPDTKFVARLDFCHFGPSKSQIQAKYRRYRQGSHKFAYRHSSATMMGRSNLPVQAWLTVILLVSVFAV